MNTYELIVLFLMIWANTVATVDLIVKIKEKKKTAKRQAKKRKR